MGSTCQSSSFFLLPLSLLSPLLPLWPAAGDENEQRRPPRVRACRSSPRADGRQPPPPARMADVYLPSMQTAGNLLARGAAVRLASSSSGMGPQRRLAAHLLQPHQPHQQHRPPRRTLPPRNRCRASASRTRQRLMAMR